MNKCKLFFSLIISLLSFFPLSCMQPKYKETKSTIINQLIPSGRDDKSYEIISNAAESHVAICSMIYTSNDTHRATFLSILNLTTSINTIYKSITEFNITSVSSLHLLNAKTAVIGHANKIYIFADETTVNSWDIIKKFFTYPCPDSILTKKNELTPTISNTDC